MIWFLEFTTALLGLTLLWNQCIKLKFKNYCGSIFILCYAPLFCIFPLIQRVLIGGALSISDKSIIDDEIVYYIYQLYNIGFLSIFYFLYKSFDSSIIVNKYNDCCLGNKAFYLPYLVFSVFLGLYLIIDATGYSIIELFTSTRFDWFLSPDFYPIQFLIGGYLISLIPIILYLLHRFKRYYLLIIILIIFIFFSFLIKDRKSLIFIISYIFALSYIIQNFSINFKFKNILFFSCILIFISFWQVYRHTILIAILDGTYDNLFNDIIDMIFYLLNNGDIPYFYNSSITAIYLNLHDDFTIPFALIRRNLFFFIPYDMSLGLKMEDVSAIFSDAINGGDSIRRGNMPPGFIGLFVLSFNWWGGLLIFLTVPFLLFKLDRLIHCRRDNFFYHTVISNFFSLVIFLLRGDDSSSFYYFLFTLFFLFSIKFLHEFFLLLKNCRVN